jgi:DNA-binding LytR/AlgR family response regulator
LSRGDSFEILDHSGKYVPVVFFADDTSYLKTALDYNCIAYLLNPVAPAAIEKALTKYRMLHDYFAATHTRHNFETSHSRHARTRMIVRSGKENVAVPLTDIVLIHTRHRNVFVVDQQGHEYTTDKTLSDIEATLDKETFFRVNRHCIVNINYVHGFKTHERVKLQVELTVPGLKHSVIVSQEMAHEFREWLYNA